MAAAPSSGSASGFVEEGLAAALVRKKQDRPSRERKLDGRAEARLIALACSAPPAGRRQWTLQLLADQLVELEVVEAVSDETVRRVLKRDQAVAERAVVHPAGGGRRVRLCDGGCPGGLPPTLRRAAAAGLPGRGQQATARRDRAAAAGRTGSTRALRLRVRPQRHGQPVHDLGTPVGLAACRSHPATDGQGLCGGVAAGWSRICTQTPTRSCW